MKTYKDALLVKIGDAQIGSTVALAPRSWNLIDGGTFLPSPAQNVIRGYFEEGVLAVKELRKRKRLILIIEEPIDGVHHGTPQLITQNTEEQQDMASTILDETLQELGFDKSKGDRLYFIEGTEAHDGTQYSNLESIARDFSEEAEFYRKDTYGKDGKISHPYKKLIINGLKYRFQHHGAGVGTRLHTYENSLRNYIKSLFMSCVAEGEEPPDWFMQGHFHRYVRTSYRGRLNGKWKTINGVTSPSLQLATSFVKRRGSTQLADLGIYFQEIDGAGNVKEHEECIYRAPEDDYERV